MMIHRSCLIALLVLPSCDGTPTSSTAAARSAPVPPAMAQRPATQPQLNEPLRIADLRAWRTPTGGWTMTGEVALDALNRRKLTSVQGSGNLLNGPAGRTSNLITREEFGDVQAHIEFMISEKSNSGVYFMGRYELQIYDSFGIAKDQYPGIECGGIYPRWIDTDLT